ncbi:MAG: hypothetical protein ACLP0J_16320 [Solirubrobacteraceae bacterium]
MPRAAATGFCSAQPYRGISRSSPSEAQALLERACNVHVDRERAERAQERQAKVRERERELLEQLTALLDDAQRAVCELSP